MMIKYFIPSINGHPMLQEYCSDLMIQEQVAFACADTIILQPPFSNDLVDNLPEDQAKASNHASKFKAGQDASLATSYLTAVSSISEEVISNLQTLKPLAEILDRHASADSDFKDDLDVFDELLQSIEEMGTKFNPDSGSFLVTPKNNHDYYQSTLIPAINDDTINLTTSINKVKDDGTLKNLFNEFVDLQNQLSAVNEEVAKGATNKIKDSVMFGFSVGSQFIGDAIEPGMIVGSVLEVAGAADEISQYEDEIKEQLDKQDQICEQMRHTATEIAQDQAEYTTLTLTAAQIKEFLKRGKTALDITGSIDDLFQGWQNQLQSLSNHAATTTDGSFFRNQIDAGLDYWVGLKGSVDSDLNKIASSSISG